MSLAALSGISTAAAAQSMMDREGPAPRIHRSSAAEVLRAAACTAAAGSPIGAAILRSVPQSAEERRAGEAMLRDGENCLHLARPIVTSVAIARGAVAETLYESQFAAPVAAPTPPIPVAPMPRPPAPVAGAPDPAPAYALAECVAATRQELVRALLAADPSTPAEQAGLRALQPAFAPCVSPDAQLRIGSDELRGLFAEALYRWSVVQRDGPVSLWAAASAH